MQYRIYRIGYKVIYFLHPMEMLKKLLKIFVVSKEIFFNKITYYPKSVINFENSFSKFIGVEHGLTFCNGTSSIEAALFALGVRKGDEIIVPSCTFHASIDPIVNLGATPVFVDVEAKSITIDIDAIKNKISEKTKCIVVVHLFGYIANINEISKLAKENNIFLLEDCSHAHGGSFDNKKVGSFGDIGCFSLQGAKAIAAGEGGIAVTSNKKFLAKMSMYGHFNRHSNIFEEKDMKYIYTGIGHKQRAHPLGIAMANIDLVFNSMYNKKMRNNEKIIKKLLSRSSSISLFSSIENSNSGGFFGGIPILINEGVDVNKVKNIFTSHGIATSHYPFELHHKLEIYNQDNANTLVNTEILKNNLLLLDRRILIYFSIATKVILKKIVIKLNKE
jgi:dTDP-4-amino-4,6-dideoxygalactose transaminase